jgi:Ser/Thr protein kinase RdoA (MazF antagonist)
MDDLATAASTWMGRRLEVDSLLLGGGEADVWSASCGAERFVIHVSATWREPAEVSWSHAVATQAATKIPEAVAPISVRGHTYFTWSGRVVAVFPFVDGDPADRGHPNQVADSGRLLARIHRALLPWQPASPPVPVEPSVVDDDLAEAELDAWWSRCLQKVRHGVCHGDYFRRNVLVSDGRIRGVIDWSDAHVGPLIREVGFAAWEFGKDDTLQLVRDRFDLFVDAYRTEASHLPEWEFGLVDGAARIALRDNIRHNIRHTARRGVSTEDDYHRRQRHAFERLKCALPEVPTA